MKFRELNIPFNFNLTLFVHYKHPYFQSSKTILTFSERGIHPLLCPYGGAVGMASTTDVDTCAASSAASSSLSHDD